MKAALPVEASKTYGQILKSSSIIGGAQGINYIIGMLRTKLVAVLLGPSGVGLVGLYASVAGLVGTIAGLGLDSSGVREVAEAHGRGDAQRLARTAQMLRRVCWLTGLLGWVLTAVFSYPLSVWTFRSPERAWAIALLGGMVLCSAVAGGSTALIQGTRRIGDLARLNVLGAVSGTVVAVGLYWWLGERGIVPVMLATAAMNLGMAWWFARRVQTVQITQTWTDALGNSKRLISLGAAFMWSALAGAAVGLGIRALIVRHHGLEANGIYQAAWGISGMFGGFIINAMGADFYPRLTAAISNPVEAGRLVNEQTEIGILLALPGLQATLAFAPWIMEIFYTGKFVSGSELLVWFVVAVFFRMITFPMGYILLAKGAGTRFAVLTSAFHVIHIALCAYLLPRFPLRSIALANVFLAGVYVIGMRRFAGSLIAFRWSDDTRVLTLLSGALIATAVILYLLLPAQWALLGGILLTSASCILSFRGVARRIGETHRLMRIAFRFPFLRRLAGI